MLQHDITNNKFYFYGAEITAERYAEVSAILDDMPMADAGYYYILTESLEWELHQAPPDEPTDVDIITVLLGGEPS